MCVWIRKFAALAACLSLAAGTGELYREGAHTSLAEQRARAVQEPVGSLNVRAATAYARANVDVYHGFCADFCFLILQAGGFVFYGDENRFRAYTQYDHLVNELGFRSYFLGNGRVTRNADKIEEGDLVMWDMGNRLAGVTSDIVSIRGMGGHIVYISVANGPNSRFISRNPVQVDALLVTGGNHGMWLIKTSDLAGEERIVARDVIPTVFELSSLSEVYMTPNGKRHYGADGHPVIKARGEVVLVDMVSRVGGFTWGRIANSGWDWIIISHSAVREAGKVPPSLGAWSNWRVS